ncbi:helix-turn-helix domain-containing protein [Azohydromonas lata]|uniref:Helix-turn-helix domain-containing protein n=1 Tax=Azohydromonas lata TaxID=45677 RepID=A0ABU5IJY8_9BURK|nr:helix-turn-helix domain-containing protein [Azohydromonas lata]MDZ5459179.1 helix-turn-helix domain-containing protein [Azohydromonas lata]
MTEPSATTPRGDSPGTMLRNARQQQGLELDALAAAIKVRADKLAALEADHYEQLPDMAFTRALAKTLCRTLKIDAAPVLAGLPASLDGSRLEQVATGLNTPFRDRPGRREARDLGPLKRPVLWVVALLLVGAAAIVLLPASWLKLGSFDSGSGGSAEVATSAAAPAASGTASAVVETVFASPTAPAAVDAAASGAAPAAATESAGLLVLRATGESWVEVRDGTNQLLLSRALHAGETVNLDGTLPLRATIGNASATSVSFRGQVLDTRSQTRDNVARLELK